MFAVFTGYGSAPRTSEVTVKKVGRKWAYFGIHDKFDIQTGAIDGYGGGRVYVSSAEYNQEQALEAVWAEIRNAVHRTWRRPEHLTVSDLAELKRILRC